MQYDICFRCASLAALVSALAPYGLTTMDEEGMVTLIAARADGTALQYHGRVEATPPEIDAEGNVITEATYYDGDYAVLRAEESILNQITGATMDGVEVLDVPPAGCPTFGDWKLRPIVSLDTLKSKAVARLQSAKWTRMLGTFRDSKGHTYAVDNDSRVLLTGKIAMLGATGQPLPANFVWKTAEMDTNGQPIYVPHDAETFLALGSEIEVWTNAVFTASETAQSEVRAAANEASVKAAESGVQWPSN